MNSEPQASSVRDWLITGILSVSLLAGAWVGRNQTSGSAPSDPAPPTSTHGPAPQEAGPNQRVTHSAMAHVFHQRWPQQLLPNGQVVLFPNHPALRLVALERRQDYLRDTGWHWR